MAGCLFFFFNDTATTEIYTLSLHDALPISDQIERLEHEPDPPVADSGSLRRDRKSTRLNSSHSQISYAVFCLKKKKNANASIKPDPVPQAHLRGAPASVAPPPRTPANHYAL